MAPRTSTAITRHALTAALSLAALGGALPAHAQAPARAATRPVGAVTTPVPVAQREFHISLPRGAVRPGVVRLSVRNLGATAHNVAVTGPGGYRSGVSGDVGAGGRLTLTLHLARPGRYRLLCLKAGHLARGMKATLRVARRL